MGKILYIKANPKEDGQSRTFKISDSFIEEYKKLNPDDEIITLDLYKEGISPLSAKQLDEIRVPNPEGGKDHPILKYAYQFLEADKYVIAEPFWNLSIPAILKAYIDYITISGITFKYTAQGPVGLCSGKKACCKGILRNANIFYSFKNILILIFNHLPLISLDVISPKSSFPASIRREKTTLSARGT